MEIQKIKENQAAFIDAFDQFIKRLQRWHGVSFDSETLKEFASISTQFNAHDFNFCHERLRDDDELVKRYKISPTIIYRLCLESKRNREKTERLKVDIESKNSLSVDKAGYTKVKKAFEELGKALKDNKKEINNGSKKQGFVLYEYLKVNGKMDRVIANGDIDEVIFKKACREKFHSTPFDVKKIHYKTLVKEQSDIKGNTIGSYTTFSAVSSTMEGSKIQTVGVY